MQETFAATLTISSVGAETRCKQLKLEAHIPAQSKIVNQPQTARKCEGTSNRKASEDFLTFDKPIFGQFLTKKFSKQFYMEQVHIPRRLDYPARFFQSDYLEMLTKTYWWTPPVFWFPMAAAMIYASKVTAVEKVIIFCVGLFLWTLLEYFFHRCVFHCEDLLPESNYFMILHFFTHGVHHFFPHDPLRLAMPPVLFGILASITWVAFNQFIPTQPLLPLFSGIFVGFTLYDLMHFYLHHGAEKSHFRHIRAMRTYHALHHYKAPNLGYGVSLKLWDRVFGTLIDNTSKQS